MNASGRLLGRGSGFGVVLLFAALPAAAQPAAQPPPPQPVLLDTPYAPANYAWILKEYVLVRDLPDGGFVTRFDYQGLFSKPGQEGMRTNIRNEFLAADPGTFDPATLAAWAVNAYNFFILDLVEGNLLTPDGEILTSVSKVGAGNFAVFDEPRYRIGEETLSLNQFERRFLFEGWDKKGKRPPELDPRRHFAIVCGAVGCPPLWPSPVTPQELNLTLDRMTRNALRSQSQLWVEGNTIHVSKIFEWYEADFGGKKGVRAFLAEYAPPGAKQLLIDDPKAKIATDIEWDWSLNAP
jgi:hypothetical protein